MTVLAQDIGQEAICPSSFSLWYTQLQGAFMEVFPFKPSQVVFVARGILQKHTVLASVVQPLPILELTVVEARPRLTPAATMMPVNPRAHHVLCLYFSATQRLGLCLCGPPLVVSFTKQEAFFPQTSCSSQSLYFCASGTR